MTRRRRRNTPRNPWWSFTRDALIVLAIGVGLSFLPGGKYDVGPWNGETAWLVRYISWAVAAGLGVAIGSRHIRGTRR
ncbi:hypothetical protein [Curtobacterium flaccumfaciens]|uniref:hypothetical protein n=1 Tax=Curtobacterium flaccumfaciens TaxID=2035 RepID=UPI001AD953E4|nr:hypothetical protein [Curtobacterium flaccumfaciens]MBO9040833.1 hypothetical protein [Curtobacterium flaccumfaciens pv. flaccumfaciens]